VSISKIGLIERSDQPGSDQEDGEGRNHLTHGARSLGRLSKKTVIAESTAVIKTTAVTAAV